MAKPFSIQSPEDIAKEYAGNKQKIAEAMQLGVVDPTAGVLAGMFIDRMRSAQMQEQGPQGTVAQQVMGGAPPAPPTAPAGGLGATPQAAPPMAPEMGMAPPQGEAPMGEMPVGMAEGGMVPPYAAGGGLSDAPIPDGMFDEPSNGGFGDGYAGGGLVAFAGGGGADLDAFRRAIIQQESGGRFGIANTEGSGAMGLGQIMPDTARALAKRLGLPYRPDLLAGKGKEAQQYQIALTNEATREAFDYGKGDIGKAAAYYFAGPDKSKWGSKTKKYQSDIMRRLGEDGPLPERDIQSPEGRRATFEDQYAVAQKRFAGLPDSGLDELAADYRKQISPEEQEKTKRFDEGVFMTTLGAALAGTEEQNFLSAVGKALAVATPGLAASKKERKEAERDARRGLREVLGLKRGEQKEVLEFARDLQAIEMGAENSELARKEAREAADLAYTRDLEKGEIEHRYKVAEIKAQGEVTNTQFEQLAAARRAQIIDRLKQNVPVTSPDGTVISGGGGRLSASEINTLANQWALYDLNRYRNQNTGVDPLGGLKRGAGATGGGGQQQVVDVPWQP